ncbi:hypothetical protein ALO70_200019 [Pseudomonas amygdali pv. eriobotryae]|uniref:Uncharacterized protein n=1 Tax=Pseudomonas amygdali pv. eriobotryae TaxID=129137 RepID=A0A0P9R273_PSEA0|nr:hypothetical protein ALO70_200019 [Pseudomonas amygdali pv. eriobotryae]RMN64608.1 hypothetical protein ALQ55_200011 [Pseudomonas savastanoi pv. savastanoi]
MTVGSWSYAETLLGAYGTLKAEQDPLGSW